MLNIYIAFIACNTHTCAMTNLYCAVKFVFVIEASRSVILATIEVKSRSVEFISVMEVSKSVAFFSDCPQCNGTWLQGAFPQL